MVGLLDGYERNKIVINIKVVGPSGKLAIRWNGIAWQNRSCGVVVRCEAVGHRRQEKVGRF